MEKKVEDLTRQLADEKQTSRRMVAKLQREVARLKSERNYAQRGESREGLMKELDRERMLRVDAEHQLHDMRIESDSCRSRLQALQDEFRKMEEMVCGMLQYKVKIDQLKQEKTNLAATFEVNLQKSRTQIGELERENMMLLNQVKKMESQMNGKGDEQDKSKLLLQRLKMLEAENSSLVLENEQQRQQYEKCLDEIANQVVQALLAQKTLREECMKLQGRVHDLEHQNRQLNYMFQQRLRYSSDSQSHSTCKTSAKMLSPVTKTAEAATTQTSPQPPPPPSSSPTQTHTEQANLPQHKLQTNKPRGPTPAFLENSTESIQSMCSDYMFDDSPGKPQMSSPPPWLKDKLDRQTEDGQSSRSSTGSPSSIPSSASPIRNLSSTSSPADRKNPPRSKSGPVLHTKIETEFPVNNTSPKVKHVSVAEAGSKSLDRGLQSGRLQLAKAGSRLHKRTKSNSKVIPTNGSAGGNRSASPSVQSKIPMSSKGTPVLSANQIPQQRQPDSVQQKKNLSTNQRTVNSPVSGSPRVSSRGIPVLSANVLPRQKSADSPKESISNGIRQKPCEVTPESKLTGPRHSTPLDSSKHRQGHGHSQGGGREGSPKLESSSHNSQSKQSVPFHSQYYYDYSDEDSDCRPVNTDCDTESTMSLNELLDNSMDGDLPLDDDFLSDWSPICLSPASHKSEYPPSMTPQGMFFNMAGGKPIVQNKSGPYATIIVKEGKSTVVVDEAYGLAGCRPLRPDNLILAPRDKQFTLCGFSSSSSSAEEAKSFTSPQQANKPETRAENSKSVVSCEKNGDDSKKVEKLEKSENGQTRCVADSVGQEHSDSSSKSSKESAPKTSTPKSEHSDANKSKSVCSKIPLLSPVSPRKAPPPVPKKPKVSKNCSPVNQTKPLLPTSKRNVANPQSKDVPPSEKTATTTTSNPSTPVTQVPPSPSVKRKSSLPVGESSCSFGSVVRNESESSSETSTSTSTIKFNPVKESDKVKNGLVLDQNGLPYLCENLTVERQRDLAAFLVQDVIERVRSQDVTIYQQKSHSTTDSSFDSVRVERSGSKDDGYSTMSSDIQPEALKEFADPGSKSDECITDSEKVADMAAAAAGRVKGQLQDFSSDPDSAMENSAHSYEMRTSSHSLSSQVSTSSGEGVLSPGHKVQNMKKFFEDAAKKTSEISDLRSPPPVTSPPTPTIHSELGKISKIPIYQECVASPKVTQVELPSRIPVTLKTTSMQNKLLPPCAKDGDRKGGNSVAEGPVFDLRKDNASLSEASSCNSSEDETSVNDGSVLATDIFYQDVSGSSSSSREDSGLGHMTSLHISEEKILEDIPEDDEWEILHNKNVQELMHNQHDVHHHHSGPLVMKDSVSMETVRPLSISSAGSIAHTLTLTLTSPTLPSMCLIKAKSESDLSPLRQPRTTSKYEDFLDGNWDSGKVPERSASFSEMDIRGPKASECLRAFRRRALCLSVDESTVLQRVQEIIQRLYTSQTSLSGKSNSSGERIKTVDFLEKLKEKEKRPYNLPVWNPKETMETFLKTSTPSPVSVTKFNTAYAEDWLLQFSKDDIDRHLNKPGLRTQEQAEPSCCHGDRADKTAQNPAPEKCSGRETESRCTSCKQRSMSSANSSHSSSTAQCRTEDGSEGVRNDDAAADDDDDDNVPADESRQSPSEEQTRFNSRFYSLCPAGPDSRSSLFSNSSRDCDANRAVSSEAARPTTTTTTTTRGQDSATDSVEPKEFELISRQIANLSKTVTDLHHSLSSLNSDIGGSTDDDLHAYPAISTFTNSGSSVLDGYHWEEDEIFMTSCGGEVIIGSSEMLAGECSDWLNNSLDEENTASCFLNSRSGGGGGEEVPERFYEIMVSGTGGQFSPGDMSSLTRLSESSSARGSGQSESCFFREKRASFNDSCLDDPLKRANMLDMMLASGGESNDSLASDIGLDHMMCQRLTGSSRKQEASHHRRQSPSSSSTSSTNQLPLDFSKFFIRYGKQEEEAVAAFDFLDEFSASNSESPSPQQQQQQQQPTHNNDNNDVEKPENHHHHHPYPPSSSSTSFCPSVCVLDCRIDSSGRVRRIDKNRRKKRADARKEQKQRENKAKGCTSRCDGQQNCRSLSSDSADYLPDESLSLSDSCHENFN